jgi:class 3 adenylate cyclase
MHKNLREFLHSAQGESQHVVVVFLDIRGFTSFARIAESTEAADFLKCAYTTMLDRYFRDAVFFKLTGDGMLVLYNYSDAASLKRTLRKTVKISLELLEAFPTLTSTDPMVNFTVPQNLGIGLARGSATVLRSGDTVLDYSGRPLNLAARLMDMARPSGVVLDESFGYDLLDERTRRRFASTQAYIDGIAEDVPIMVHYLADRTRIPERNKFPINRFTRVSQAEILPYSEIRERGNFRHTLKQEPARTDDIEVHVSYSQARPDGSKHPSLRWVPTYHAKYKKVQNQHTALVDYRKVCAEADIRVVEPDWPVTVTIEYSVRETDTEPVTTQPTAVNG